MLQEINKELLLSLNSLTQYPIIEAFICIFADLPIFFLPLFLVSLWVYYSYKKVHEKKEKLLLVFYSTVIAILISITIQQFIVFDRPESALDAAGKLLLEHIPDASFPSDHTAVGFSFVFALLAAGYKKTGYIFLPFVIIMVLSRVIAGVHWPFDIIAGIFVAAIASSVTFHFLQKQKLVKSLNKCIIKLGNFLKL